MSAQSKSVADTLDRLSFDANFLMGRVDALPDRGPAAVVAILPALRGFLHALQPNKPDFDDVERRALQVRSAEFRSKEVSGGASIDQLLPESVYPPNALKTVRRAIQLAHEAETFLAIHPQIKAPRYTATTTEPGQFRLHHLTNKSDIVFYDQYKAMLDFAGSTAAQTLRKSPVAAEREMVRTGVELPLAIARDYLRDMDSAPGECRGEIRAAVKDFRKAVRAATTLPEQAARDMLAIGTLASRFTDNLTRRDKGGIVASKALKEEFGVQVVPVPKSFRRPLQSGVSAHL